MIYPVSIEDWYYNPDSAFYEERERLEKLLPRLKCEECGRPITREGYVFHSITFHSITFGYYNEAWCSKGCLRKRT